MALERSINRAAYNGDVESVRRLLASGASPNYRDSFDETPVDALCKMGGNTDGRAACLELLRDAGTNLDAANRHGMTPLHYAAGGGDAKIVSLLVEFGVNVNAEAEFHGTPLHLAAKSSSPIGNATACVEVLLAAGASVNARNGESETPWDVALKYFSTSRMWPLFLRAGAEIVVGPDFHLRPRYIRRVYYAGGFKKYARNHLAAVTKLFKDNGRGLPPEVVRQIMKFWLHAGYY